MLELQIVADVELQDTERLFRRSGRVGSAEVAVKVRSNGFALVDPEPDEVQAIDRYPIDLSIWLVGRKDEDRQLAETTAIFENLVTARPDVPLLLVHNLDTLVSAHLPGAGTRTFDPPITPDSEDIETWRPWVVS